ncbi:MAG: IS1634 family transposase [bacterium]
MYFKIAKSKGNKYLQLVESYRNEAGKPRQRLLANLCNISKCSDDEIRRLCKSFLKSMQVEDIAFLEDLHCEESYDYGDVLPIVALWQKLNLDDIIMDSLSNRVQIDVARATLIMVANKFVDPQSKLGAWRWFDRSVFKFAEEFEPLKPKDRGLLHTLYRSLDYLARNKNAMEEALYYHLQCYGLETELVLYDVTSSYFEGEQAELAEYGYSRDHRRDRPQIVVGVVTSREGIPFAHFVFGGNTVDKSTVQAVIHDLKERFRIRYCVFVGDRGLITRTNLDTIKGEEYNYIMGIRRHNSRLVRQLLPFIEQHPTDSIIEIRQEQIREEKVRAQFSPQTRFLMGFNEEVQKQVRQTREQHLEAFEEFLASLTQEGELDKVSRSRAKVYSYLKQKRLTRYFTVAIESSSSHYRLKVTKNHQALEQEKLIDGHFFIQTEVKEQDLDSEGVIQSYQSLQKVERMFRVLKNNIELRPIYVRKENRIRGHVFICFLTYLMECLLEKLIAEEDLPKHSLLSYKEELARIKLVPVKLSNRITGNQDTLYFVTGGHSEIQKLYSALKIKNFRHPEKLYFDNKRNGTGNFENQLSLFPIFSMT